jgi:hypothetical protein
MSSVSGRRCPRCSLIVRRLQGLLSSNPGDALRAPSGIWPQPVLRVPSNRTPEKTDCRRPNSVPAHAAGRATTFPRERPVMPRTGLWALRLRRFRGSALCMISQAAFAGTRICLSTGRNVLSRRFERGSLQLRSAYRVRHADWSAQAYRQPWLQRVKTRALADPPLSACFFEPRADQNFRAELGGQERQPTLLSCADSSADDRRRGPARAGSRTLRMWCATVCASQ